MRTCPPVTRPFVGHVSGSYAGIASRFGPCSRSPLPRNWSGRVRWASAASDAIPTSISTTHREANKKNELKEVQGRKAVKRVHGVRVYDSLPQGWEMRIGIETHAQIKTREKLFSQAVIKPFRPPVPPSTTYAPFDAAIPGTLPRINSVAVDLCLRAALALECTISPVAQFDRKHYFYRDLPPGYQITMRYKPLAKDGKLKLRFDDGQLPYVEDEVDVGIEQLQIEQDTAKSYRVLLDTGSVDHVEMAGKTREEIRVDLNRAGVGLMEIVSKPDMWKPEQAGAYVRKLQSVLRRIGASDGNMEAGSMRCDVNVSVHRKGETAIGGARTEIKNVNSARFIMNAIVYEASRQVQILQSGGEVLNETRGYDEVKGETFSLRSKAGSEDYRYMPDPNLPPLYITPEDLRRVKATLPELPDDLRERLIKQYAISTHNVNALLRFDDESLVARELELERSMGQVVQAEEALATMPTAVGYFESLAPGRTPQTVANWIVNEVARNLGTRLFYQNPLKAEHLGELIDLVTTKQVSAGVAKIVLAELLSETPPPDVQDLVLKARQSISCPIFNLLKARNLLLLDQEELTSLCHTVVHDLGSIIQSAEKKGNVAKVLPRLVGEVMKRARGRADPEATNTLINSLVLQSS